MAAEGKCISHVDGKVIFLSGCAPGDVVDATLTRIKSSFLEGKVTAIKQLSSDRVTPFCMHFGLCGGCAWQHLSYSVQLRYKQQQVVDNLERIGGLTIPTLSPILPSDEIRYYRNRLDFTFSTKGWLTFEELRADKKAAPALGFHIPKMFDKVFDVKECHLQAEPSNAMRLAVRDEAMKQKIPFYDLREHQGFLRTLTIRSAAAGDVMVILQVAAANMEWIELLLERLERDFSNITSFNYIINQKKNDTFQDQQIINWKGLPYITESMSKPDGSGVLQFRVGPKSFYQTNSAQAYKLYLTAWQLAALQGDEMVYDLYTGTGTIANFVAANARHVVGLEYVPEAIEDAKVNSQINKISNTSFFAGDIKKLLDDDFLSAHGKPDVVITDPPRNGMDKDVCLMLMKAAPKKIVYVSCNPATQARDLALLSEQYDITVVQPVDMFPHTMHVENVVKMELKNR